MKYLKLFENFEDIHKICEKYGITVYTINTDGSIDVDDNVDLNDFGLTKLPLKFNKVSGNFECYYNKLTTLEGSPKSVGGDFYCRYNKLTSLEGSPKSVGGNFHCNDNNLTTLLGSPKLVGGFFNCQVNKILTFEGAPNHVGGDFYCAYNPISNIWDLFGDYSKVELLNDLDPIRGKDILMDRFNTFLSMIGEDEVLSVKGYNCIN
jgi:hypothetical protein